MTGIRDANTIGEVAAVADLIARSFDRLAVNHDLVPDPSRRLPVMRDFFRLQVEHAFRLHVGRVLVTDDLAAAAVWFRRTIPASPPDAYDKRLAELAGAYVPRFQNLDVLLEAHHPTGRHWHLAFLAVEPDRQGHGLGTALLHHTLRWLDTHQMPAYLEATNRENRRLYQRHGFKDHGDPIEFGDRSTFYPMWRAAAVPGDPSPGPPGVHLLAEPGSSQ